MKRTEFSPRQRKHLVKTPSGHWAYVPPLLPPKLDLTLPTLRRLSDADRSLGLLAGLSRHLNDPRLFIRPFVRREAVLSSRIEGTQADLTQLVLFEAGPRVTSGVNVSDDVREVANYGLALDLGLKRLATLPPSLRWMRELHAVLLQGVRGHERALGQFRDYQNFIGPRGAAIDRATYVPPPLPHMRAGLQGLERYLHAKSELPPLIRLAMIHYQFEALHPFGDGNGRVGRLITSLLLVSWDVLPHPLLYLSAFFEKHRAAYYGRLKAVSTQGEWEEWIAFFLEGVFEQANDAVDRASRLLDLRERYIAQLRPGRPTDVLLRLLDAFMERIALSVGESSRLLDVTYAGAARNMEKLVREGIVEEATGQARNRIFVARDVLQLVQG